jgi:hypothetical protein
MYIYNIAYTMFCVLLLFAFIDAGPDHPWMIAAGAKCVYKYG